MVVIGLLLAFLIFRAWNQRTSESEAARAEEAQIALRRQAIQSNFADLRDVVRQHAVTLVRKRRQTVYVDDYGKVRSEAWVREVDYFIDNVVPDRILQWIDRATVAESIEDELNYFEETSDLSATLGNYRPDMTGVEFEHFIADKFREHGWDITPTPTTGDQGVDLIVRKDGLSLAVQCKRSSSPVGNKAVQEAAAGMIHYAAKEAWVVSDADFTPAARRLANTTGVQLYHYDILSDLLESME